MKFLFDLFPVILFFAIFKWGEGRPEIAQSLVDQFLSGFLSGGAASASQSPILLATAFAIVASFAQIFFLLMRKKKVEPMLWVSLAIITLFGGATIYFQSEEFIKWKPTVLYWFFGSALLISNLMMRKNLIRSMMEKQIQLPDPVWSKLNVAWIGFFAVMGVLNLYVAFWGDFATATWVNFKLFGGMGLMFAFVLAQSAYLSKYMKDVS